MFDSPEIRCLAAQLQESVVGKTISAMSAGSRTHKFFFLDRPVSEDEPQVVRAQIVRCEGLGKTLLLSLDNGLCIGLFEFGGSLELTDSPKPLCHWQMGFEDGVWLSLTLQQWGCLRVGKREDVLTGYASYDAAKDPLGDGFTLERLREAAEKPEAAKLPVKTFITNRSVVDGIGNGLLQDILFLARLLPSRKVGTLSPQDIVALHRALCEITAEVRNQGGRDTEKDLFGHPGRYRPLMDKRTAGLPCPACGTPITKASYLGGSCYYCQNCQR